MRKSASGFTIVELLIVIVVIAILATISVVTYDGIQARAQNSQTLSAATAWLKAFKAYEVDHGELPHTGWDSCLGSDYPWDFEGNTSGDNQCRSASSSYYREKASINDALSPYMNNQIPSPSMQTVGTPSSWFRGVLYIAPVVGGQLQLAVVLAETDICPSINGIDNSSANGFDNGIVCRYHLGTRLR